MDYTPNYSLALPGYLDRQTADPPAPGDIPYLQPINDGMTTIDLELHAASLHRQEISAVNGLVKGDGLGGFVGMAAMTPFFEVTAQSGRYYPLCYGLSAALTTGASAANRIELVPTIWPFPVTGSPVQLTISIYVTVLGGNFKVLVYNCNANQQPNALLAESASTSAAAVGLKTVTVSLTGVNTLKIGDKLFIGLWTSGAPTVRRYDLGSSYSFGGIGAGANTTFGTVLRRILAYGSAPASWVYSSAEIVNGANPAAFYYSV